MWVVQAVLYDPPGFGQVYPEEQVSYEWLHVEEYLDCESLWTHALSFGLPLCVQVVDPEVVPQVLVGWLPPVHAVQLPLTVPVVQYAWQVVHPQFPFGTVDVYASLGLGQLFAAIHCTQQPSYWFGLHE